MENYNQLCVVHGVICESSEELEKFMEDTFGVRVKYEAEVKTNPDLDDNGNPIPETGGRNDLFFYVHDEDIKKFAVPRLQSGIRWWEDVIKYNHNSYLYSQEFIDAHPVTW